MCMFIKMVQSKTVSVAEIVGVLGVVVEDRGLQGDQIIGTLYTMLKKMNFIL